jgi:hypothetical protein
MMSKKYISSEAITEQRAKLFKSGLRKKKRKQKEKKRLWIDGQH